MRHIYLYSHNLDSGQWRIRVVALIFIFFQDILDASGVSLALIGPGSVDQVYSDDVFAMSC